MNIMKIRVTYFHRNPSAGFSIARVFRTIVDEVSKSGEVVEHYVPSRRALPWHMIQNIYYVFENRDKSGLNHISGDIHYCILALIGCKSVLTIHDTVFIDNVKNPFKRFFKWLFWLYLPVKISSEVICISSKTRESVLKYVKKEKIRVIHNAADPRICFSFKTMNKDDITILHIGCGWNKNLERVIEALARFPYVIHLRIIGKLSKFQIKLLEDSNITYSNKYDLTDEQVVNEYRDSDVVCFPSIYEGFGMPVIEGQKAGRVVLTSYIEPLIEIAGGAACLIDPEDIVSIKNGFLKLIENDAFRDNIVKRGLENIKRFDVKFVVSQYIDVYKSLYDLSNKFT